MTYRDEAKLIQMQELVLELLTTLDERGLDFEEFSKLLNNMRIRNEKR